MAFQADPCRGVTCKARKRYGGHAEGFPDGLGNVPIA